MVIMNELYLFELDCIYKKQIIPTYFEIHYLDDVQIMYEYSELIMFSFKRLFSK